MKTRSNQSGLKDKDENEANDEFFLVKSLVDTY